MNLTQNHWPERSPRVVSVRPIDGYRLDLTFNDEALGVVDMDGWLIGGKGVMEPLKDREFFQQVSLDEEAGTIQWPDGVDLCPDVLYGRATGIPIPFAAADRPTAAR